MKELSKIEDGKQKNSIEKLIKTLTQATDFKELLSAKPAEIFADCKKTNMLSDFSKMIVKTADEAQSSDTLSHIKKNLHVQKNISKFVGNDFLDQSLITYTDDQGKRRTLLLVRIPSGDVNEDVAKALADAGAKNIINLGTVGKFNDELVSNLKINNIEEATPDKPQDNLTVFSNASKVTRKLMKNENIDTKDKELMTYVITRCLLNGVSIEGLDWLAGNFDGDVSDLGDSQAISSRWLGKIQNIIKSPYTNEETFNHLRFLGTKLKKLVETLQENGGNTSPYNIFVAGSAVKGRLSTSSDLDVYLDTEDQRLLDAAFQKTPFGYCVKNKDPLMTVGPYKYIANRIEFYKPAIDIGNAKEALKDPDFLVKLFIDLTENYGLKLKTEDGKLKVTIDEKTAAEASQKEGSIAADKLMGYEKKYWSFMGTDVLSRDFLAPYLKDIKSSEEIGNIPLSRFLDFGNELVNSYLPRHFTKENFEKFLKTPEGKVFLDSPKMREFFEKENVKPSKLADELVRRKDLDISRLIKLEDLPQILGLTEPIEGLSILFTGAERLYNSEDKRYMPFDKEIREAIMRWQ
jgi:hypothetical protein